MRGREEWLNLLAEKFGALVGRTVVAWAAVEWAPFEESASEPIFDGPDDPYLQLAFLELTSERADSMVVHTYQDDSAWGLGDQDGHVGPSSWEGARRFSHLQLPVGAVESVEPRFEDDILTEVLLRTAGTDLLLIAGEFFAGWAGGGDVCRFDESVPVFSDPAAATGSPGPRPGHRGPRKTAPVNCPFCPTVASGRRTFPR